MRIAVLLISLLASAAALATKPSPMTEAAPFATATSTSAPSTASASATVSPITTTSTGGTSLANGAVTVTERSVGLAHGAPIPPQCPSGLVPGRRGKRGIDFGLGGLSAICTAPDESQAAAIQAARDHDLALVRAQAELLKAQAEADREAAARIRTETQCTACGVVK